MSELPTTVVVDLAAIYPPTSPAPTPLSRGAVALGQRDKLRHLATGTNVTIEEPTFPSPYSAGVPEYFAGPEDKTSPLEL